MDVHDSGGQGDRHILRLYVAGPTRQSTRALVNLRKICEEHLKGRYEMEVVDLLQNPEIAAQDQIIAAPTLVRLSPAPVRRLIGDLSQTERVLMILDLAPLVGDEI
ncbi:MAG: circadian clock protein KaiB [Verrucomicrobiaceae bacterium]|nr:MAG: circadian clock protein KaiB [Verrucomicrobiaceae bacterium]